MTKANHLKDFFLGVVGVAVGFAILFLLLYPEHMVLERWVAPAEGFTLPVWLEDYDDVQFRWVLVSSAALALIWMSLTSFVDSGFSGDRRSGWVFLYVLALIVAAYAAFFRLPDAQAGQTLAMLFALLNGVIAFWLMTALTSPQTHKFAPFLSAYLRRGW